MTKSSPRLWSLGLANIVRQLSMLVVGLAVLFFANCSGDSADTRRRISSKPPTRTKNVRTPESWVSKTKTKWPQIVLTNYAEFRGHSPLQGASSFLLKTDDERVFAATAAHLIGPAGGVEPELQPSDLRRRLLDWKMFPRTASHDSITVNSLAPTALHLLDSDWLILSIKDADSLPAYPLKVRADPVRIGENVFLIGCPYTEKDCKQNVYTGVVTERGFGDLFRYDIQPPVDIRGFSGAPIIDRDGYLVGVMTVWFEPKMAGDKFLEAGGEGVTSIYDFLPNAN